MSTNRVNMRLPLTLATTLVVMLAGASSAHAVETYTGPVKEIPSSRIGWEVNKTTSGGVCLFASEPCRQATLSSEPGGFEDATAAAVDNDSASPQYGHVYVVDMQHRLQELEADGSFVRMFGWDVNRTKVEAGGATTQAEKNVCTAVEVKAGATCQAGVEGSAPGQLGETQGSIAVDPTSGTVYVADRVKVRPSTGEITNGMRVQEFTAEGAWAGEIGKEVNETASKTPGATPEQKNLCTQQEIEASKGVVKCAGPAEYDVERPNEPPGNATEPGVFPIERSPILAVGGSEDLLYAGSGHRVQRFHANATFEGQSPLTGTVTQMALDDSCELQQPALSEPACASFDPSFGDLYVLLLEGTTVHKLKPSGEQLAEFPLSARVAGAQFFVDALAVDASGRLVAGEAEGMAVEVASFGSVLSNSTGHPVTEFPVPSSGNINTLSLSAGGVMYATTQNEVLSYASVHAAELLTRPSPCVLGTESETDVTFDCTLKGEANPEEVQETTASFQWGFSPALGVETPAQTLCTTACDGALAPLAPAALTAARPNETVFYRVAAHDENVKAPELLTSDTASFLTETVRPRVVAPPSAQFVSASSAVLFDQLNPENAPTKSFFEYAPELGAYCTGPLRTGTLESAVYGRTGATLEVTGLQPATSYRYRLCAENAAGEARDEHGGNEIPEGSFTTAPASLPQAITGPYSALGSSTATISGTVNPDGQPATYAFELGVANGATTQYGVVFSGSAGSGGAPVSETLGLSGLQPGTTYAYRITIKAGTGEPVQGESATFTTAGLPSVLAVPGVLAQLSIPDIAFPGPAIATVVKPATKALTNAQKLAKALEACKRAHESRKRRAGCEKRARARYAKSKQANNRKKG